MHKDRIKGVGFFEDDLVCQKVLLKSKQQVPQSSVFGKLNSLSSVAL